MTSTTSRFRFWLPGALLLVAGLLVVAGWQASPAWATNGESHSGQGGDPSLEELLSEDVLGLVANAEALRELGSANKQVWEVWFCDFPPVGNVNPDFDFATQALEDTFTPYFEWLSDGRYSPTFVKGGIVHALSLDHIPDHIRCARPVRESVGNRDRPAVIFSDLSPGFSNGGIAVSFDGGSIAHISSKWMFDNGEFSPPTSAVLLHEMGHGLGWPHSGGPFYEYANRMDIMAAGGWGRGTIAFNRYVSGWIDVGDVIVYERDLGSRGYVLSPLRVEGDQMLVVPHHSGERGVFYTLGARVAQGFDDNISKEGVEVYLIDQREGGLYYNIQPVPPSLMQNGGNLHVLGVGDSVDLGTVRVTVTERTAGDRFGVEVVPVDPTVITVEWSSDWVEVPEGDPDDEIDNGVWERDNAQLIFSEPLPKDIILKISAKTGAKHCKHPALDWTSLKRTDRGYGRWWTFSEGTEVENLFLRPQSRVFTEEPYIRWWAADLTYQPDQTFCLTIPELPTGMQWKDPDRTVLPVTLLNDDEPIYVEWESSELITVPEGNPTNEGDYTEWPSPTSITTKLTFSEPVPRPFRLNVWFRYGDGCSHPRLPVNPVWTNSDDMGIGDDEWIDAQHKTVDVPKEAEDVEITIRWTADREYEPDETFCIYIPPTFGPVSLRTDLTSYFPPLSLLERPNPHHATSNHRKRRPAHFRRMGK